VPREKIWGNRELELSLSMNFCLFCHRKDCVLCVSLEPSFRNSWAGWQRRFPHGKSSVFEDSFVPHQIKSKELSVWENMHGIQLVSKNQFIASSDI